MKKKVSVVVNLELEIQEQHVEGFQYYLEGNIFEALQGYPYSVTKIETEIVEIEDAEQMDEVAFEAEDMRIKRSGIAV